MAVRLDVSLAAGVLTVWDGDLLIRPLPCGHGSNSGDKQREGDRRTPIGNFLVCYRNPASRFRLSLGLNYPLPEDADRGLAAGLITAEQHANILAAHDRIADYAQPGNVADGDSSMTPDWYTPLGGEIMIHGGWDGQRGTAGCVAVSDADIDWLYPLCAIGTPVAIRP